MASTIKVDKIEGSTGSTITVPTGQTFTITDGLAVSGGGTGLASFTAGDILYATGTTTLAKLAKGTAEQVLAMNSGATAPDWGSVDLTVLPTITVAKGGTNLTSFTAGDILYATGATTLAKLAKGSGSDTLKMNSGATAPEWVTVAPATSDVVKLTNQTATSGSTFDIDGHFTSDYRFYRIWFHKMQSSTTNATLYLRMLVSSSADSGSYYMGTSARSYTDSTPTNQENYFGDADATTTARILYGDFISNDSEKLGCTGWVDIHDPLSTDKYKSIDYLYGQDTESSPLQVQYGHWRYSNINACSGVQLYVDNGTFSSIDVTLYGYK